MPRAEKHTLFLFLVFALLGLSRVDSRAGWNPDRRFDPAVLDSLCREYDDAGSFYLYRARKVIAHFDPDSDTIAGEIYRDYEIWIRKSSRLEDHSRIVVSDDPLTSLVGVDVEVLSRSGRKIRGFDKGDLVWNSLMARGGGVINLDRRISFAAIPGLSTGQRVRVRIHYRFSGYHGMPNLVMGGMEIPCASDLVLVQVPAGTEFSWQTVGPAELDDLVRHGVENRKDSSEYSWAIENVPVISRRDRVDPDSLRLNLVTHVTGPDGMPPGAGSFCAAGSWQEVARSYRKLIEDRMAATPELVQLAARLTAGCRNDLQKIDALYAHVQGTTRYLGIYEGLEGIIPETPESVMAKKYGDCKGLAVYLIALLRAVDIQAWPVLVRTSHLGSLAREIPDPVQFNHFIVWADDGAGGIWMDATLEKCPAGAIYPQDARSPVLTMRPGHEGLVEIPFAAWSPGQMEYRLTGRIGPDRRLVLRTELEASGVTGIRLRASQSGLGEKERCRLRRSLLMPESIPMRETSGTFGGGDNWASPANWTLDLEGGRPLPGTGTSLFLPVTLIGIPDPDRNHDPLKMPDRVEKWSIVLPNGWTVGGDSLVIRKCGLSWSRFVWQEGDTLRLVREIRWDRDNPAGIPARDRFSAEKEAFAAERSFITLVKGTASE